MPRKYWAAVRALIRAAAAASWQWHPCGELQACVSLAQHGRSVSSHCKLKNKLVISCDLQQMINQKNVRWQCR